MSTSLILPPAAFQPTIERAGRGLETGIVLVQRHALLIAPSPSENPLRLDSDYIMQTSQARRSVRSTSAQDAVGGTGVSKFKIEYLAEDKATLRIEVVTLAGTTWVDTAGADIMAIHDINCIGPTGRVPAGDIQMNTAAAGAGSVFATIKAGNNEWLTARMCIPLNRRLFIRSIHASAESGARVRWTNGTDFTAEGGGIVDQSREVYIPDGAGGTVALHDEMTIVDPGGAFEAYAKTATGKRVFLTVTGYEVLL